MKRSQKKRPKWQDHYSRKAKKENFPARSVFKLEEIQQKHQLIKKGGRILDLGCSPGSWLIYAARIVGETGHVVGIDLKPVTVPLPKTVSVYEHDIFSRDDVSAALGGETFHVVMSDMAPSTTGNKHVDSARSYNLSEAAFMIARGTLVPGGAFICKIFQGEDFDRFFNMVKKDYRTYKIYKPKSTRKASREIYVIGMEKHAESTCTI
ncbi:MAG: RlmE family RNA methyltransferase [Desulfobacterales bacterium]